LRAAVAELVVVRSHPRVEPVVAEDLHIGLQAGHMGLQAWSHGVAGHSMLTDLWPAVVG